MESEVLKRKSIISAMSLFFQSGYSAMLGFFANVILTIYLSPQIFGIYITVLSIISLLNYFSDIGLAASLIQREHVRSEDVKTAFTVQQLLIISIVVIGYVLTAPIMRFYGLNADGRFLYWTLLFGFFISSLKTIPSVFLERAVRFDKIVLVQIIENTCFYITVIICAMHGYGLLSFAYGVLLRSCIGLIAVYIISPWMPRIGIVRTSLKDLLSYGVPFQSMSFLAIIKDELVNLFLGKLIGFSALGYIGWAKKWAESSLRIIMDNINRVVFPLFSRIQSEPDKQKSVMERILKYQSMIMIPACLGMMMLMPLIVELLPKYEKWRPALPIFYIFVASSLFSGYSNPFINYFNGIGKIKLSLGFMVFWTVSTWLLLIPLSKAFGMFGFPLTVLILSLTFIIVLLKARTFIAFDFLGIVTRYLVSGLGMVGVLYGARIIFASTGVWIIPLVIGAGMVTYYGILRLLFGEDLISEAREILDPIMNRNA